MRYFLRALGEPRLEDPEGEALDLPAGKPYALLGWLLLSPTPHPRDEAVRLLWPDVPDKRGRASLRQALWLLRRVTDPDAILSEGEQLEVPAGVFETDVETLETAVVSGELEKAAGMWREGPFAEISIPDAPEWNRWADGVHARLEGMLGRALMERGEAVGASGDLEEALAWFERAVGIQPYLEAPRLAHLRCLLDLHRREEAEGALAEARAVITRPSTDAFESVQERLREMRQSHRTGAGAAGPPTEFVGRSAEFARLSGLWRSARSGRPRLAATLGPPGIGKTRLAREFLRTAERDGTAISLRCFPGDEEIEWGVIPGLARELLQLPGAAGISASSNEVLRAVSPSLGHGAGAEVARPHAAAVTDALADLVSAVAEEQPLLVHVDDLQWADAKSVAVLVRLARSVRGAPVMVLLAGREGAAAETHLRRLEDEGMALLLPLGPLSASEITEMLGLLADFSSPADAGTLSDRFLRVSGGNPLIIVEVLRELWEEGRLTEGTDGRWIFDPLLVRGDLPLPADLGKVVGARLARLTPDERAVAGALARSTRDRPVEWVVGRAEVEPEEALRALDSLVQKGLVRRRGDGTLDFAHDLVRDAVRDHTGGVAPRRSAVRWALMGTAAAVVASLAAWNALAEPWEAPYGGGDVFILGAEEMVQARIGPGPELEITSVQKQRPLAPVRQVFRTTGGGIRRFAYAYDSVSAPWVAEWHGPDSLETVYRTPGDDNLEGLHPDGRYAVVKTQNLDAPEYQLQLVRVDLRTGAERLLLRAPHHITGGAWSRDGSRIASIIRAPRDTLVLMDPSGSRVLTAVTPEGSVSRPEWCGERATIALSVIPPRSGPVLHFLDVAEGSWSRHSTAYDLADGAVACSPDGRGILYWGLVDGRRALVLEDLESGRATPLHTPTNIRGLQLTWLPPDPAPVPQTVWIARDTVRLAWGQRDTVEARIRMSDGTWQDGGFDWISTDENVAPTDSTGSVWGNRPGGVWLIASHHGWLRDSVRVVVEGTADHAPLLVDDFATLDPERWSLIGSPVPTAESYAGEPVLRMRGDGRHQDGMISREAFDLTGGGTLELDFRMSVSREDRQYVRVCLVSGEGRLPDTYLPAPSVLGIPRHHACFNHPRPTFVGFEPAGFELHSSLRPMGTDAATDVLPADDWVHLALQLRADGQVSLRLDHELVRTLAHPVPMDLPWRVRLMGASVDTQLLIRNLVLWSGARY